MAKVRRKKTERVAWIFDWDGTCAVPTVEGEEAFRQAYLDDFAANFQLDRGWTETRFDAHLATARAEPATHGWLRSGRIVAPTDIDAFVRAQVPAQMLLRELHPNENIDQFGPYLDTLYQAHYLKCTSVLRPETVGVWEALRERGTLFYIVTNSDATKVRKRLAEFDPTVEAWVGPLVRGLAKKFEVTDEPTWLPMHTHFGALKRMIHTRKGHYYKVLRAIMAEHGLTWEDLRVIGDIAELDLAMPVIMGARGLLMRGPNTPDYELAWAKSHPRVKIVTDLREVLRR